MFLSILPKHAWGGGPPAGRLDILPGTGRGTSRRLVEGGGHQRGDRGGHRTDVSNHTGGGNADDAVALLLQEPQSRIVPFRTIGALMRFAVDLDDQPGLSAEKIGDIGPNRMLATELGTGLSATQLLP